MDAYLNKNLVKRNPSCLNIAVMLEKFCNFNRLSPETRQNKSLRILACYTYAGIT